MVKTAISILVSFLLLLGISYFETTYVQTTFQTFEKQLTALYKKTEAETSSYEDGKAVRDFWLEKKKVLHIWIPHTSIETVDYQLNEAMGYLYEQKHVDAMPKIEVLIEISKRIPRLFSVKLENIF